MKAGDRTASARTMSFIANAAGSRGRDTSPDSDIVAECRISMQSCSRLNNGSAIDFQIGDSGNGRLAGHR